MSEKMYIQDVGPVHWRSFWRQALRCAAPDHPAGMLVPDDDSPSTVTYQGMDGWNHGYHHATITYRPGKRLVVLERGADPRAASLTSSYLYLKEVLFDAAFPSECLDERVP